jgi:hypothetical protein|tara:strand:+ start:216 stop:641 length:426 start_codon:yes stop_codon:yes gene_type:complete
MSTPIVISPPPPPEGQLQDYSVDQLAGAVVLVLGAVASLLLVLWQSKCLCKVNLCYIFQCERRPPSEEEMKGLKDQAKELQNNRDKAQQDKKQDKILKKEEKILEKEDEILKAQPRRSPRLSRQNSPEPEPEMISSSWKKL